MQDFLAVFVTALTPHIVIAMVGGVIGASFSSDVKAYGWRLTILVMFGAVLISAAVADSLISHFHLESIWLIGAAGVFAGIPSGASMDALKAASPKLAGHLVDGVGIGIVDKVTAFFFPSKNKLEEKKDGEK